MQDERQPQTKQTRTTCSYCESAGQRNVLLQRFSIEPGCYIHKIHKASRRLLLLRLFLGRLRLRSWQLELVRVRRRNYF